MNPILKFNFRNWIRSPGPFYVFGFPFFLILLMGQWIVMSSILPSIILFTTIEIAIFSFGASFSDLRNSVIIKRIGAIKYSKTYFLISQIVFTVIVTFMGIAWMLMLSSGMMWITNNTQFHIIPQFTTFNVNYQTYSVPNGTELTFNRDVGNPWIGNEITVTLMPNSTLTYTYALAGDPETLISKTETTTTNEIIEIVIPENTIYFGADSILKGGTRFERGAVFIQPNDFSGFANVSWIFLIYGLLVSTILSIMFAFLIVALTKTTEQYNIYSQLMFVGIGLFGGIFIGNQAVIYNSELLYPISFLLPHSYTTEFIRASFDGITIFNMPDGVGLNEIQGATLDVYDPNQTYLIHSMAADVVIPLLAIWGLAEVCKKKFKWAV